MDEDLCSELIDRIAENSSELTPKDTGHPKQLNTLNNIRAVVLDVYGTMFISGTGDISLAGDQDSEGAIRSALESTGFQITDESAVSVMTSLYEEAVTNFMKQVKQDGVDFPEVNVLKIWLDVLRELKNRGLITGLVDQRIAYIFAVEYECRANPIWPMPDLKAFLEKVNGRGFDLGIVSNSQFYTPLMFDAMLGASIDELGFDEKLCHWSYRYLIGKPSLMLYEKLVEALNNNYDYGPGEVLYVGNDMLKDIYPADRLGFKTALFAGDTRSLKLRADDERCKEVTPDITVTQLSQLLDCI